MLTHHAPLAVLGKGYQRPFELATLRLYNMNTVLGNCEATTTGCFARGPPACLARLCIGCVRLYNTNTCLATVSCGGWLEECAAVEEDLRLLLGSLLPTAAGWICCSDRLEGCPATHRPDRSRFSWRSHHGCKAATPALAAAGKDLAPSNAQLLTQQGGCIAFDGQSTIFRWAGACAAAWLPQLLALFKPVPAAPATLLHLVHPAALATGTPIPAF